MIIYMGSNVSAVTFAGHKKQNGGLGEKRRSNDILCASVIEIF